MKTHYLKTLILSAFAFGLSVTLALASENEAESLRNVMNGSPTDIALSKSSVAEESAVGTVVGTFSATDPDAGDTFTYAVSGTDASFFSVSGNQLKIATSPDFETKNVLAITVTVTDAGGGSFSKNFTIDVTDITTDETKVTAYFVPTRDYSGNYPNGKFNTLYKIDWKKVSHVMLAGVAPDNNGNWFMGYDWGGNNLTRESMAALIPQLIDSIRTKNPNIKILPMIGGGKEYFEDWVEQKNGKTRAVLIAKLITYLERVGYDGVDLDLEGAAITPSWEAFVLELKTALKNSSRNFFFSGALAPWYQSNTTNKGAQAFDFVNIMTYDATGNWDPNKPGQHSSLAFARQGFNYYKGRGVTADKLAIGIPTYGYWFGGGKAGGFGYSSVVQWDTSNATKDQFTRNGRTYYYNGLPTVKSKVKFAKDNNCHIMVFRLGIDATGEYERFSILHHIAKSMKEYGMTLWSDDSSPSPPRNLKADKINKRSIKLTWQAPANTATVRGYEIYRDNTKIGEITGASLSYTDTRLTPNRAYEYSVKALGIGNFSSPLTAKLKVSTLPVRPRPPRGLTFEALTSTSVKLMWQPPNHSGVTSYDIHRDGVYLTTVTNLEYTDSSLGLNRGHNYYVYAVFSRGVYSTASNIVATTRKPWPPRSLSAEALSATSIKITWQAPNHTGIKSYDVYRDGVYLSTTTGLEYTDTNLTPDKSYTYYALSVISKDAYSLRGNSSTTTTLKLETPRSLKSQILSATSVKLTWQAPAHGGAKTYHIYRNNTKIAEATGLAYTDSGLAPNKSYTYYVLSVFSESLYSFPSSLVTANPQLRPPGSLSAEALSAASIKLTWQAPVHRVNSYDVYRNGTWLATVGGLEYTDRNLTPNTTYTYFMLSVLSRGVYSSQSNSASATTPQLGPPRSLSAEVLGSTSVKLTWQAPTHGDVGMYDVYRNGAWLTTATGLEYTDRNLTPGTTYTYFVLSVLSTGAYSSQSNSATATLPAGSGVASERASDEGLGNIALTDDVQKQTTDIILYPNPVTDSFTLKIPVETTSEMVEVQVFDNDSRIIHSEKLRLVKGTNRVEVNSKTYLAGTYIVKIKRGTKVVTKVIVKK